ncbi:MAG: transposase [Planctomycetaceae bacterium]
MVLTLRWWPGRRHLKSASRTARTIVRPQLTEAQWLRMADLFPDKPMTRAGGRPMIPPRPCLEGILWMLTSGAHEWKVDQTSFRHLQLAGGDFATGPVAVCGNGRGHDCSVSMKASTN